MIDFNLLKKEINNTTSFDSCISSEDLKMSLLSIVLTLLNNENLFFYGESKMIENKVKINEHEDLLQLLHSSSSLLFFKTSGTTGTPKKVTKNIERLVDGVMLLPELQNNVWGFCYSTRHISGLYVMLQAVMTNSKLVDIRNLSSEMLAEEIANNNITNISAPATFYKLNFPLLETVASVVKVTNGGEPLDVNVINNVKKSFPNASIRNVYASTEFGSLLVSKSSAFSIPDRLKDKVKIEESRLWVHQSLLSKFEGSTQEWFDTKDMVNVNEDNSFEIIGRISEDVKVLGHLVSLRKIEQTIAQIPQISLAKVTATPHAVFGNLLSCEVVLKVIDSITKQEIKKHIKESLRDYERPMKIQIVENIVTTSSGKIKRG